MRLFRIRPLTRTAHAVSASPRKTGRGVALYAQRGKAQLALEAVTGTKMHDRRTTRAYRRRPVRRRGGLHQRRRAACAVGPRRPIPADGMEARLQTRLRHAGIAGRRRLPARPMGLVADGRAAVASRSGLLLA